MKWKVIRIQRNNFALEMKLSLNSLFTALAFFLANVTYGQQDTLIGGSDDVVVTATRTERKLSNVAVPVILIQQKELQATQLRRLNEILQEQTGIFVTSGSGSSSFGGGIFGNGAQLQGMSPEYTLILVNGEPIIGRQAGVVNLSRLTISGIKKIEVIKGPVSSLYGSEAMGGVINIITELPHGSGSAVNVKAGGYGLFDATASGTLAHGNTRANLAYNHFRLGAIDHNKEVYGNQQDPFFNHTFQANLSHSFSPRTRLLMYGRFFAERSDNKYEVADNGLETQKVAGYTTIYDGNLNTSLQHNFSDRVSSTLRLYGTGYRSLQNLDLEKDGTRFYNDNFRQQFYRVENQTDISLPQHNKLTAGGGYVYEHLNTTRYEGARTNSIAYAFLQNEWKPRENLNLIGGIRYDHNEAYASRFSPKLAVRYSPSERLKLTASYGAGFKAPDLRQLYLSFINSASGGYALFGANEISIAKLQELQQLGMVQTILPRAYDLATLKPETSHGINAGATYQFSNKVTGEVNVFNNDIANQILFDVIALRPNGSQVFSYFNVARSFTRGIETNLRYQFHSFWSVSGGYQLLSTGDKDIVDGIKQGNLYGRDEQTGQVYRLQRSDYYGLPGRSRHMANVKLMYESAQSGWQASVRAIYRSRWGTFDQDGNGIINRRDETARGFVMLNATIQKALSHTLLLGSGVENMLNHRDANNLPNIPGINAFVSVSWKWNDHGNRRQLSKK
ncbi:MAG TPA: TonB-dependent receptor [Phnomibacter sp.]|nr:TonB-dependent receptor [Phnomibacter sp.]